MPAKKTVVVTGFGPFKGHKVNASWVSVQELNKLGLDVEGVDLVICELPVVYQKVQELVPQLWNKYSPVLMVHVGVSGVATELTLEQQAHNEGYQRDDVEGQVPASCRCVDDCCNNLIASGINMALVCEEVNSVNQAVSSVVSFDAGRYLCDFTYFLSLHTNRDCTAFVHVPPLGTPYSAAEIAVGLKSAIQAMLKQIVSAP